MHRSLPSTGWALGFVSLLALGACRFDGAGLGSVSDGGPADVAADSRADLRPVGDGSGSEEEGGRPDGATLDGGALDLSPDQGTKTTPPYQVTAEGWALRAPLMGYSERIRAFWATAADDVWAVGDRGLVVHYNGDGWRRVSVSTSKDLRGVWGSAPDDVWVCGQDGTLLRFDGGALATVSISTQKDLEAIHGSAGDDVWVVGEGGVVLHRSAVGWSSENTGESFHLRGVHAASRSAVWAAGQSNKALFFDGSSWRVETTESHEWRRAVFARSASDVWLAASNGVSRYDGATWVETNLSGMPVLRGLDGDSARLWAAGDNRIYQHDGNTWALDHTLPPGSSLSALRRGFGVTYVGGWGSYLAHDGGSGDWRRILEHPSYLRSVAAGGGKVWIGGDQAFVAVEDGSGWRRVPWQTTHNASVTGLWVDASGVAWAVTSDGRIARYAAASGELVQEHDDSRGLRGIWGSSAQTLVAVGDYGTVLARGASGVWTAQSGPGNEYWRGIWGSGPQDIYIVGGRGKVARYNGTSWVPVAVGPLEEQDLYAVHGRSAQDVWVVGQSGLVWHLDNTSWRAVSGKGAFSHDKDLRGVYVAPSGRAWIVAAGDGVVYSGLDDQTPWTTHLTGGDSFDVQAIWGTGEADLWIVGTSGNVRHYKE